MNTRSAFHKAKRLTSHWLGLSCLWLLLGIHSPASAAVSISVYPANASVEQGASQQYTAYVPLTPNTAQWLVNDVVGGNATFGTISATGIYTAPATVPSPNVITIKSRSTATPTVFGTVTATIVRKYPYLWSVNPTSVSVGTFQTCLNGANFTTDSIVLVNGTPAQTTYSSATSLIVTGTASAPGTVQIAVQQPGLGGQTSAPVNLTVTAVPVVVKVSPVAATVQLGATQSFTPSLTGTSNTAVTWSISSGGGAISSAGVYSAPATMPASTSVVIKVASNASPSASATATITLVAPPPPPVIVSVSPPAANVPLKGTATFTSTVTGAANTAVVWAIVKGGGSIDPSTGVYTAPAAMPASSLVSISATSVAQPTSAASASITLLPPPPPQVWLTGARFLEQSSFGPSPATLAEIQQKGIPTFLNDQFNAPETVIPPFYSNSTAEMTQWALYNYSTAPDQLRQRVAYSLSQIIVTSTNKLIYPNATLPWLRLLSKYSFGNYKDLLRDVTMCPSMGKYLDLVNSAKPAISGAANENYARELMQLFTIGLSQLNPDGTLVLDSNGNPIPTYDQTTVQQMALALTGWVYANNAYEDFTAPMVANENRHDMSAKSILGQSFPANQTAEQDLEMILTTLMNHPNTAPFISTRLIRSLVTSNPSPAYVQRVASVFLDNGSGVSGDLKAVITAILMDPEARNDTPTVNGGRLKEPILNTCGLLRALGGGFTPTHGLTYLYDYVSQSVLTPPSVFSWCSPLYRLPANRALFGPEFQIYSPTDSSLRGNYFQAMLSNPGPDVVIDLTPFQPYGNDMPDLVEAVNQVLLYGRMPAGMKQALITAAAPGYDAPTRIQTVLYLTALSGQFAVQY